ncbi:MAG: alanine--glyoxylate aminotransferase family protein [Epsilonproteobacteria bacterium]|nr:alanine--glyoxylate aminotransferase family protein [Campylobacterota bacterium]
MLLFTPGPTPVKEEVRLEMAKPTIHHRTPEFEAIFKSARENLKELMKMDEVIFLASSGTGAMEASILNLCHKKALVVNAGKFGERFGKIVKAFNLELVELKYEWDSPANIEDIKRALREHSDIDAVALQICESSGGLRHPIEEIAKVVKEHNKNIVVIADGITAVGVEEIDIENIDALITGSQKALMLPPGLAMIGLSSLAVEKIGEGRGFYFNLKSELKKQQQNTTAYTPATTLIIGLNKVFEEIEKFGGFERLYSTTKARHKAMLKALEALHLKIYPKAPALAMATIIDSDSEKIRKILKSEFSVNVAGGQEHLKGKIFRVNNMGLIEDYEMLWVIDSIEKALDKLGRANYKGVGVKVFNEVFRESNDI